MAAQTYFAILFAVIAYRLVTDKAATEDSRGIGVFLGWAAMMLWATA